MTTRAGRAAPALTITDWHLPADGASGEHRADLLPAGLVVVRGDNATGKTLLAHRLHATARALGTTPPPAAPPTTGIEPAGDGTQAQRTADGYLPASLRVGLRLADCVIVASRQEGQGAVVLSTSSGHAVEGDLVWRIDRSFGSTRLVTFHDVLDGGPSVADALAALGPGASTLRREAGDPAAVEAALDAAIAELHTSDDENSPLVRLGLAAAQAAGAVAAAEALPPVMERLVADHATTAADVTAHEEELSKLVAELLRYASVPSAEDLATAEASLDELDHLASVSTPLDRPLSDSATAGPEVPPAGGRAVVGRWLQPALLGLTLLLVAGSIGFLLSGADAVAAAGGLAALVAVFGAVVAATPEETRAARSSATAIPPASGPAGAALDILARVSPAQVATSPLLGQGGAVPVPTGERLRVVAALLHLGLPLDDANVRRRRADVAAYRLARAHADGVSARARYVSAHLATARRTLVDLERCVRHQQTEDRHADELVGGEQPGHEQLDDLRLRQTVLARRFEDTASTWQRLVLARHLLQTARLRSVVADASPEGTVDVFLNRLSGGALTALQFGEPLSVIDAQGRCRPLPELSRSETQRVGLALVLAAALEPPETTGAPIPPLLLDDVLVGLDADGRNAAVRLIAEVAERRQVLLFTSEAEIADTCRRVRRGVRVVELR